MKPFLSLLFAIASSVIADTPCRRSFRFADVVITGGITSAVYGDFDEDGRADIAVMLGNIRIVTLNRGGRVFEPLPRQSVVFPSLSAAPLVAATDVNRDGHLDLLYRINNSISVALGDGHGAFGALRNTALQNNSDSSWRLIDFNHDGLLDFVGLYRTDVTFEPSRGDGTFSVAATNFMGGGNVQSEVTLTGDFDGDGHIDALRVATDLDKDQTVERFDWNDGTLHFTRSEERGALPLSVQPVDIDGDGAEELVGIDNGSLVVGRAKNRQLTVQTFAVAAPGVSIDITDPVMADTDGDGIKIWCSAPSTRSASFAGRRTVSGPRCFTEHPARPACRRSISTATAAPISRHRAARAACRFCSMEMRAAFTRWLTHHALSITPTSTAMENAT